MYLSAPFSSMVEKIPTTHKLLRKLPELIEKHRMEDGKIDVDSFMKEFRRNFGRYGGEYWTNSHERTSREVLIPVAAPGFADAQVADAQIYFPNEKLKEGIEAVKAALKEGSKAKSVAVGGEKPLQYIPYYQKIIEAFIRAHNELVDEFGERFALLALRGGMAARNAATIPVKVREKERSFGADWEKPKIRTYMGVIPDVDPFIVIRNLQPRDKAKAAGIIERHLRSAGIPPALIDIRPDDGVVSDRDYESMAHSLHRLKPLLVFRGKELLKELWNVPEFRRYEVMEAERYWDKIDELDKRWFGKVLRPTSKMLGLLAIEDEATANKVLAYLKRALQERFRINHSTRTSKKLFDRVLGTVTVIKRWREEGTLDEKLRHDQDLKLVNNLLKHPKRLYRAILFATANDREAKEMYHVLKKALDLNKVPPEYKKKILAAFAVGVLRGREQVGKYLQEGLGMEKAEDYGFAKIPKDIEIIRKNKLRKNDSRSN